MILAGLQFLLVLFAGTYYLVAEYRWLGIIPVVIALIQTAAWIIVLAEVNRMIAKRQEASMPEPPNRDEKTPEPISHR